MFSHIFVGADDVAASKKVYDAVLGTIGVPEGKADPKGRGLLIAPRPGMTGLTKPIDGEAATHANGGTIGFGCDSSEKVKRIPRCGRCERRRASRIRPDCVRGVRSSISPISRDPCGNKICALHRG